MQLGYVRRLAAVGGALLLAGSLQARATPVYATFEVVGNLGDSPIQWTSLPTPRYVFMIDLDRDGTFTWASGSVVTIVDDAPTDNFYAEELVGNFVTSSVGGLLKANNYAQWTVWPTAKSNIWGSGPTSGGVSYTTRTSIYVQSDVDKVQVDGFWSDSIPLIGAQSFLTPGALWTIYDTARNDSGGEVFGFFRASLTSLSDTDPTAVVPEPGTLALAAIAMLAAASRRRRHHRA
jgi:hypothetical protein